MEQVEKTSINWTNLAYLFAFSFILSLFFPIRFVFPTSEAFITGQFSDFTAISLYLSDILLVITSIFTVISHKDRGFSHFKTFAPLILWVFLMFSLRYGPFPKLNTYYLIKFLEFIVAYGTFKLLFSKTIIKSGYLKVFAFLGSLEAILGIIQFYKNGPLGLGLLGEQAIFPLQNGVAKMLINNALQIRGYGTFPHPNPFSAFLLASVLILCYLLQNATKTWQKAVYGLALALNILGLVTTFSRAAFLALGIGLVLYFGSLFSKKQLGSRGVQALLVVLISLVTSFSVFKPYLLARADVSGEAVLNRVTYAKAGLRMIQDHPIMGMGLGESLLHMKQYSSQIRWPWEIQPIHNYFLLAAAELGIPGAVILTWFILTHLWKLVKGIKDKVLKNPPLASYYLLLAAVLLSFLVLMQFDHYFYTLQQTQLLLWILLGAIAAESFADSRAVLK